MSDQMLISRFYPELLEGFPQPADGVVQLHAELLHRICLADGLLEVLDWSQQGVGTDPLACMWLAGLRWHRLVTGHVPDEAPEPPPRDTDAALSRLLASGALRITEHTGETSLSSLSAGQLHYPAAPAQPDTGDTDVLLRLAPLGLVPYIEEQMRMEWVEQNVSMTHGGAHLLQRSRALVADVHQRASSPQQHPPHQPGPQPRSQADAPTAQPGSHPLFGVVGELAQRWEAVTAPQ
ncbi:hypothetical protein [Garicola koreensis]|uniref:Uncharacterized protein n=1 Tax=Garicola koreensis TaxID=1262554 RepID=A0A7W5TTP0_9MICC|nr:hypothetical protein [Garicola koreensis]MBB3667303.1 hypothetical protein [Garicola koreensis]